MVGLLSIKAMNYSLVTRDLIGCIVTDIRFVIPLQTEWSTLKYAKNSKVMYTQI